MNLIRYKSYEEIIFSKKSSYKTVSFYFTFTLFKCYRAINQNQPEIMSFLMNKNGSPKEY